MRKYFFNKNAITPVTMSEESGQSFQKAYKHIEAALIYNGRLYPEKSGFFQATKREIEYCKPTPDSKVFVHIGRITEEKIQLMLVRAFNQLLKDKTDAVLLIIGGGRATQSSRTIQDNLQRITQNNSRIFWLKERNNATDYLHLADYFCLASIFE